ncbi:40S ribosomal protein S15a-like [Octodon degus]|uniref:Small ribosomal subunit protein uS8 n=1 Tax=Octodon degus TaxID=10160 RepID=A0A6P3VBC6_OCTDE|nr:40S ribosomal protein S15a-like [Octodon degus]
MALCYPMAEGLNKGHKPQRGPRLLERPDPGSQEVSVGKRGGRPGQETAGGAHSGSFHPLSVLHNDVHVPADPLKTNNAENRGKRLVLLRPCSKVPGPVIQFLTVMMKCGYIGEFEIIGDHRAGKIVVNLTGRLNKRGMISPRFDVQLKDLEKRQNNLLSSRQLGFIVLTTLVGIMDHEEARRKHTGEKVLGFFF